MTQVDFPEYGMTDAIATLLTSLGHAQDPQGHSLPAGAALNADSLASGYISVLSQYRLLVIEGPDTAKFLQGQTTCDFNEIDGSRVRYGALCNLKGRMLASFRAAKLGDGRYALRMRRGLEASVREVLAKYMVFSKAKFTEQGDDWIVLGAGGAAATDALRAHFGALPEAADAALAVDGGWLLDCGKQRYECWLQAEPALALWRAMSDTLSPQPSSLWTLANIQDGLGEICDLTREVFIPQELNLQLTGAVNFKKGCYTGQEVVARLQYRGKLKHHMYRLRFEGQAPAPVTPLQAGDSDRRVGQIVCAIATGAHGGEALALVNDEALAHLPLTAGPDCALIEVLPLPYAIN